MKHDDDRSGAEEEKRFEKSVSEKVEHRRLSRGEADRHDHVTELGKRRVGEDALNVVLLRRNERGHHRGDRADPRNDQERFR